MKSGYRKYLPFQPVALPDRKWPDRKIEKAPVWCSVDLRDGNQALVNPMNLEEKLSFFQRKPDSPKSHGRIGLFLQIERAVFRSRFRFFFPYKQPVYPLRYRLSG